MAERSGRTHGRRNKPPLMNKTQARKLFPNKILNRFSLDCIILFPSPIAAQCRAHINELGSNNVSLTSDIDLNMRM